MTAKQERLIPKRREMEPNRRMPKGSCVKCENYEVVEGLPCLWKLESQIDKATQHMYIALEKKNWNQVKKASRHMDNALSFVRKITAFHRVNHRKLSDILHSKDKENPK